MILVDTSVWVEFFRGRRPTADRLRMLLEEDEVALAAPVRLEILSGASPRDLPRLRRVLDALPLFRPTDAAWGRMEGWVEEAARSGERFGVGDLLIAAVAAERGLPLWSLDDDFRRMGGLGFLELHRP